MNINLAKGSYKNFFLLFLFAFLSSFFFASRVLAERGTGGAAGGTSAPINGCGGGPRTICYSSWNTGGEDNSQGGGGEWVHISMEELLTKNPGLDVNNISYKSVRSSIPVIDVDSARHLDYNGDSQMIRGCGQAKGVYVFVSHKYYNNAPTFTPVGTAYGPNKFAYFQFPLYRNKAPVGNNLLKPHEKYVNRAGTYHVEYDAAEAAFEQFRHDANRYDLTWRDGEFSWFCSYGEPPQGCDPNDPTCDKNRKPDCDPNTDPTCSDKRKDCPLDDPTCTPKGSDICSALVPGVIGSSYKGNTAAISQVTNLSYTGTENYKKWQPFVLARPGDSIRFRHALCYAAQGVGHDLAKSTENYTITADSPSIANKFRLYASRNNNEDNRYLFKNSALADGNERSVLTQSPHAITGAGIVSADYGFYTESPTDSPSPSYSCDNTIFTQNNNRAIHDGFQIPGFASGVSNCNSANQTGSSTEVGNKITQGIAYNDVKSWVSSVTKVSGECSCGTNTATSDTQTNKTFENAGTFRAKDAQGNYNDQGVVGITDTL